MKNSIIFFLLAIVLYAASASVYKDSKSFDSEKEIELYTRLATNNQFLRNQYYTNEKEVKKLLVKSAIVESKVVFDKFNKEFLTFDKAFEKDSLVLIKDYNQMVKSVLVSLSNYLKEYEQRDLNPKYLKDKFSLDENKHDYSLEELENNYLLFKIQALEVFQYSGLAYGCKFIEFPKPLHIYQAQNDSTNKYNLTFNFYETFNSDYYKNWEIEITNSSIPLEQVTNNIFELPNKPKETIYIEGKAVLKDEFGDDIIRPFQKYIHPDEIEASIN